MIVGIDSGASHMEIAVADDGGHIVGRKRIEGSPSLRGNSEALTQLIVDELRVMSTDASTSAVVVGAAGAGDETVREGFEHLLHARLPGSDVYVTTDIETAVTSAFPDRRGIVVASGTGSFAARRNGDGTITRAGGLGPGTGDPGSAYYLATIALDWITGPTPDTEGERLRRALFEATHTADRTELTQWRASASRFIVASLARNVCCAHAPGEEITDTFIQKTATELFNLAGALAIEQPLDIALTGGLVANDTPVRAALVTLLDADPRFGSYDVLIDSAAGAVALAVSRLAGRA